MPTAALKSCSHPACPNKQAKGRCALHARQADIRRGSQRERGYTHTWGKASKAFLQDYPLCGMRPYGAQPVMSQCHAKGYTTAAQHTDHVVPHRGNTALFWDREGNWQALCVQCHSAKTRAGL